MHLIEWKSDSLLSARLAGSMSLESVESFREDLLEQLDGVRGPVDCEICFCSAGTMPMRICEEFFALRDDALAHGADKITFRLPVQRDVIRLRQKRLSQVSAGREEYLLGAA